MLALKERDLDAQPFRVHLFEPWEPLPCAGIDLVRLVHMGARPYVPLVPFFHIADDQICHPTTFFAGYPTISKATWESTTLP